MAFLMKTCFGPDEDTMDDIMLADVVALTEPTVPDSKDIEDVSTPKLNAHSKYSIAVAIDFGTDGSGLCYGFPDGDIRFHNQFKSAKFGTFTKQKTHILLDEAGEFQSFGIDASYSYMTLPSNKQKKFALFQGFKMSLYQNQLYQNYNTKKLQKEKQRKKQIKQLLSSFNGHSQVPAEKVFVAALKHLQKEAMKYLKKMKRSKKLSFKASDIQWILTVPAIWDETAKHQMRDWAKKAGLINCDSQCMIVLEPDGASLAVQHSILQNQTDIGGGSHAFQHGERYILVDVGGGTCDIACHQVLAQEQGYGVKEVYHPSGGAFGANYIDEEFVHMLEKIFTKQWMDEFREEYSNRYVELVHNFRLAKESYGKLAETEDRIHSMHYMKLPEEFVTFLDEKCETMTDDETSTFKYEPNDIEPEHIFENAQIGGAQNLLSLIRPQSMEEDSDYYLAIHDTVWKYLFDVIVTKIVDDCRGILAHPQMQDCKYMILVGGLACNAYYTQRMRHTFGEQLSIVIPPHPMLAVVEGAVRFAYQPDYIKARVLSKSYGISVSYPLEACQSVNVDKAFIEENKFERSKGEWWVDNLFYPLAFKNQSITLGKAIYYSFMRRHNTCSKVKLQLYSTDSDEMPLTIDDARIQKFASINPLVSVCFEDANNMELMVKIIFHDSLLRIYAYPKTLYAQSFTEKELELEYEHY